jgi:hypothetical protein
LAGNNSDPKPHLPEGAIVPSGPAEVAYVQGLVARGEAVKVAPGEPLPPGATHEIVGETASGVPIVKRRRFASY